MRPNLVRPSAAFRSPRLVPAMLSLLALGAAGCHSVTSGVHSVEGRSFYRHGDYAAAQQSFQRAVAKDPRNADHWHNLAAAARKQGDHATAEQMYRQAIHVNPMHQPSYHQLAAMLRETGRSDEAYQTIAGWANTQPYNAQAHIEHAWIQRENGDVASAEQSLRHALQIQPGHPTALAQMGYLYETTGNSHMASSMYKRSLAGNWYQPGLHDRLTSLRGHGHGHPGPGAVVPAGAVAHQTWGPAIATMPPAPHAAHPGPPQPTFATEPTMVPEPALASAPPLPLPSIEPTEPGPVLATQPVLQAPGPLQTDPSPAGPTPGTTPVSALPAVQPF